MFSPIFADTLFGLEHGEHHQAKKRSVKICTKIKVIKRSIAQMKMRHQHELMRIRKGEMEGEENYFQLFNCNSHFYSSCLRFLKQQGTRDPELI